MSLNVLTWVFWVFFTFMEGVSSIRALHELEKSWCSDLPTPCACSAKTEWPHWCETDTPHTHETNMNKKQKKNPPARKTVGAPCHVRTRIVHGTCIRSLMTNRCPLSLLTSSGRFSIIPVSEASQVGSGDEPPPVHPTIFFIFFFAFNFALFTSYVIISFGGGALREVEWEETAKGHSGSRSLLPPLNHFRGQKEIIGDRANYSSVPAVSGAEQGVTRGDLAGTQQKKQDLNEGGVYSWTEVSLIVSSPGTFVKVEKTDQSV